MKENKDHIHFPVINPEQFSGDEVIFGDTKLVDYWRWAHSNLIDNTERGAFAEYLVHTAVGATSKTRTNWDKYDVLSPEGIRIEVKAAGYIQSWAQKKLSTISFSIRPTYGWDAETNQYSEECVRQSDVYVFCLHKQTEQETVNILDVSQWTFFVLPTAIMNAKIELKIGKNIRQIREKQNMTQETLATKLQLNGCDITRSAVAKIEVGQRHLYPDEIILIKEILNTTFENIFYGDDQK